MNAASRTTPAAKPAMLRALPHVRRGRTGVLRGRRARRDQRDGDRRDRGHGHEDAGPAEVLEQPAAHDGPERDGHSADGAPQADGPGSFPAGGEHVRDEGEGGRERHGGPEPHHRPGRDELSRAGGEPAGQAGRAEHGEPSQQHALAAEPVGQAAERQQQRGEDQVVGVDHPLQLGGGGMQLAHQRGQRHVHDRGVEVDHESGEQQRHEDHWLGSHA
jgi:hypothetical protein